jgi:hypothetical protein
MNTFQISPRRQLYRRFYQESLSEQFVRPAAIKGVSPMKRTISVVACLALLIQMSACTTAKVHRVPAPDVQNPAIEKVVGITTKGGEDVAFNPPGATIRNGKLEAAVKGKRYEIPVDQIERYWIERREPSTARTVGLAAGIVVGSLVLIAGIVALTKESCPFVYSWDGQQYVFDSEPYGGAITRGLERDDYSELEHLAADKGRYRLMIRNEVAETQYTNLMELMVADHSAGRVAMGDAGKLYTLASVQKPEIAVDETGRNLVPWLRETDRLIWEAEPEKDPAARIRQEIRLTFPKPPSAARAKLVVNAATSLWGSYMIKALLELRGSDVNAWYSTMDNNPVDRAALRAWNEREELLMLKIEVQEPEGWVQRGLLLGGGPFVLEDRVVDLDVSHAKGSRLNVRIRPPKGFWAFNSFAVDYTPDQAVELQTLRPVECLDSGGRDQLPQITGVDDSYYEMPNIGDQGFLSFNAPPEKPGLKRTVFLHTRGYYRIHLDGTGPSDAGLLTRITAFPDTAARFAGLRFAQWQRAPQIQH